MNSYWTVESMVFSWDRLYYIAERTLGFESVHLEVQRGQCWYQFIVGGR